MHTKLILKSLGLFIVTGILQLSGIVILPFVLLFVPKSKEVLPDAFAWFDNHEIRLKQGSMDDGLAGPAYYRDDMVKKYGLYLTRYIWLAFRNPVNYFQYSVLGFLVDRTTKFDVTKYGPQVGNQEGDKAGLSVLVATDSDGESTADIYYVVKLTKARCLRIRIGHKLKDPSETKPYIAQYVCTFNLAEYLGD